MISSQLWQLVWMQCLRLVHYSVHGFKHFLIGKQFHWCARCVVVLEVFLFLKMLCALYFNGFFSEDSRTAIILQLITWVVLGTGMSVIQYTPRHVLLKIICKLSLKKSLKFGNREVSRNQLLWAFFSGNLYPKRIRGHHDLGKKEGLCTLSHVPWWIWAWF
jgi:hypothetical protein